MNKTVKLVSAVLHGLGFLYIVGCASVSEQSSVVNAQETGVKKETKVETPTRSNRNLSANRY